MRHDVTLPLFVEVDAIFNFACPASPVHYQFDPVATTKVSVNGAINMLGLAKRLKAPILQASTSEIYGDPSQHPQTESYWGNVNTIGPRACYDEGKRCAETLFFDYRRQHGVEIKVMRIFNTYGPRMHPNDGRVVSNFIVQALKGEPITIYGEGTQTRSFCYVDDLIDGALAPDADARRLHRARSTSATPSEFTILRTRRTWSSTLPVRSRSSSSRRCPRTIRASAARTFRWPSVRSNGGRRCSCRKDLGSRSDISSACWRATPRRRRGSTRGACASTSMR